MEESKSEHSRCTSIRKGATCISAINLGNEKTNYYTTTVQVCCRHISHPMNVHVYYLQTNIFRPLHAVVVVPIFSNLINLLDKIICGIRINATNIDICAEVKGATVGFTINDAMIYPCNNLEKQYSVLSTGLSYAPVNTKFPPLEDVVESGFAWSLNITLLTGHYRFGADSGRGKKVCFLRVTGAECTVSVPPILGTLVSGTSPVGKHLKICISRTNLVSLRFHPDHVKMLSIPLLELFLGSSAFRSWIQNLQKESDYSCRQYKPLAEELKSYENHWKSQIRSNTYKPHPLDRKISVCHMVVLRARVAKWRNYPCPTVVDSRALSGGVVKALDLKERLINRNNSEPSDGREGIRISDEEVPEHILGGAQLYTHNFREIENCNALLYWLCNEWVYHTEVRGPPISEFGMSIMVDNFEALVLKEGGKSGDSAANLSNNNSDDDDDLQASFTFSCYEAQLNYNILLARVPDIPSVAAAPQNKKDEELIPYLLDVSPLAIGANGQMESEDQPVNSIELDVYGVSFIDVEQLKDDVPYCSLVSTQKDHTTYLALKNFTRENMHITLHQTGEMFVMLRPERFWAICEAILLGTSDMVSFFSDPVESAPYSPDEDVRSEELPQDTAESPLQTDEGFFYTPQLGDSPSKVGQICLFMPQLGINFDVKLKSVSIVLIEDVKSVNCAILLFRSSLDAMVCSGCMKEKLKVDAREISLLPMICTGVDRVLNVENHMNLLRSAIEYTEQRIEFDIDASPLPETEEVQKMRNVIMGGMNYAELGYKVIEKEPLLHPTVIHIQYKSFLQTENTGEESDTRAPSDRNEDKGVINEPLHGYSTPYVYVTLCVDVVELLELSDREALAADEFVVDAFNGRQVLTATICNEVLHTREGKALPDPNKFGALYQEYLSFCLPRSDTVQDISVSIRSPTESMDLASGTLQAKPRATKKDGSNLPPVRVLLKDQSGKNYGHAVMHAHIDPAFLLVSFLKIKPSLSSVVIIQVHIGRRVGMLKIDPYKMRKKHKTRGVAEGLLFDIQTKNPRVYILAFIQGQEDHRVTCDIVFDLNNRGFNKISLAGSTIYFSLDLVRYSRPESDPLSGLGGYPGAMSATSIGSAFDPLRKGSIQPPYPGGYYPGIPQKYMDYLQIKEVKEKEESIGSTLIGSLDFNAKRGIFLRITDLDVIVLQRISTSVMEGVNVIQRSITKTSAVEAAEDENEEVLQVVQLLRRAFERADLDNSGTLNENEVKLLLQRYLTTLSEDELDVQVQRFMTVAGVNDMGTVNLENFTSAMQKVLAEGKDPEVIKRARNRAIVEAFIEADTDGSGELDRNDVTILLRSLTPSAITSEIELAVDNFMRLADIDGSGFVNLDEFVYLCDVLSSGLVEGRVPMLAADFCCSDLRKQLVEGNVQSSERRHGDRHSDKVMTLGKFLATKDPNYRPKMVWRVIDRDLGVGSLPKASTNIDDPRFSDEHLDESQCKLVKAFRNYMLAREVWGLVVVPELCDEFLPRVSSIEVVDSRVACVQMLAPLAIGNELYTGSSPGHLRLIGLPTALKKAVVTGIRTSLKDRRSRNTRNLTFKVSGPCDIHVCVYKQARGTVVLPSWLRRSGYRQRKLVLEAEYEFPRRQETKKRVQFVLFSRTQKSAGTVVLGGNEGIQYHYVVLISPPSESYEFEGDSQSFVIVAGVQGKRPFDSHTLRWRLRPSSVLSNNDAWYRSINARARQRTISINELVSRVGIAVTGGNDAAKSPTIPMASFKSFQISVTMLMGPIKLQLINVSRAQSLGSRLDAPLLEVCLDTLPESTPVIQICNAEGCTRMVNADSTTHYGVVPSANSGGLFCDRHIIRCSVNKCEKMATHCLAKETEPIFCSDHASHKMVPYLALGMNPNKANMELRGPEMRLFWCHPADSNMLDRRDKMTMRAIFGLKVRYFNTLARQTEHLIEPWGAVLKAGSMTDDSFISVVFAAPLHFGINVTTSFLSSLQLLSSMFSNLNPFLKESQSTAYGELGLYSKWSFRILDPSRHMKVRNRLGVPITVSMASVLSDSGHETTVVPKTNDFMWKRKKRRKHLNDIKKSKRKGSGARTGNLDDITIPDGKVGELFIPNLDAVNHLRVQLTPDGFAPILDIEFDFFSKREQIFHLVHSHDVKKNDKEEEISNHTPGASLAELNEELSEPFSNISSSNISSSNISSSEFDSEDAGDVEAFVTRGKKQPLISKRKGPVAVVIKFIQEQTDDSDTLDVIMEVSTNISVYNDTFSPILVNLTPESAGGSNDFCLERGGLIPLPVQVLSHELLYITEKEPGVRDEPLELTPYMFDVDGTTFSRHTSEVLKNCMSIQMTDPGAEEREQVDRIQKSIKTKGFSRPPVLWQLTVEPPYVIVNALPLSIKVEITQQKGFGGEPDLQIFYLESGGVVDVSVLDLTNALQARVQLGGGGKLSRPFAIEADQHLCRSELVKVPVRALDPEGGPQISVSVNWESVTMPRTITVFSEVWVSNRTGVAMCYRTPKSGNTRSKQMLNSTPLLKDILPYHDGDNAVPSNMRLLDEAYYTTDVKSTLICKGFNHMDEDTTSYIGSFTSGTGEDQSSTTDCLIPPTLLHCPTHCLQILPQYMAQDATNEDSFCLYDITCRSQALPRCMSFFPHEFVSGSPMQIYSDMLNLRLKFPVEIHSSSSSCIHVLLDYYGRTNNSNDPGLVSESSQNYISFVCDVNCYIYIALDAQEGGVPPVSPVWLRRVGFVLINEQEGAVKAMGCYVVVRNGFYFYRRFFVAGSRVMLGRVEALVAVACKNKINSCHTIADISVVKMHSISKSLTKKSMCRYWYVVPEWSPSISVYSDGKSCCVEAPPTLPSGRPIPPLTLIQTKQEIASFSMSVHKRHGDYALASFAVLQDSSVLLCYDSRSESVPNWVMIDNWKKREGFVFKVHECDGKDAAFSYNVFTKDFCSGSIIRLGRRWPKGKPYFIFIHVKVDDNSDGVVVTNVRSPDMLPQFSADAFWNTEANGPLVQIPLQLDWKGRSWSLPVSTHTIRDVGTMCTQSGVFGVTVNVLPGVFHVTREVSLYPPVVIKNELDCPILVVPCLEAPSEVDDGPKQQFSNFRRKLQKYKRNRKVKKKRRELIALRKKFTGRDGQQYIIPQSIYTDTEGNPVFISSRSYVKHVSPGESVAVYDFVDNANPDSIFMDEGVRDKIPRQRCFRIISTWPSWENDTLSNISHQSLNPDVSVADDNSTTLSNDTCNFGQGPEFNDEEASHQTTGSGVEVSEIDGSEPEVSLPIFYEHIGETSHLWLKQGHYGKLLVKAACQLQPNQATVLVRLRDVSKHPPMRIDNLSSYRTLIYRIGCSQNVHTLGPMRWRAFVWGDDSRTLHVGIVVDDERRHELLGFLRKSSFIHQRLSSQNSSLGSRNNTRLRRPTLERQTAGLELEHELMKAPPKNLDTLNLKPYTLQAVGAQPKLIPSDGERPMLVECIRRREVLATLALTFKDAPEKVRLYQLQPNLFQKDELSDSSDDDDDVNVDSSMHEETTRQSKTLLEIIVQAVYFSSFRINIAGGFITLVHSTTAGPKELISITWDDLVLEKGEFNDHFHLSLWHVQVDDLQPTAINSIIMQPMNSGFNSHRESTMTARPFCTLESERDLEILVSHHIQSFALLRLCVKPLKCFIYIDGFVDIALLFMDALSWAIPDDDHRRELSSAQVMESLNAKLTLPPVAPANIYLTRFEAELPLMQVRFHLGRKVTGLLGTKLLTGEEDDFPDDEGFLSSPLMGGAIVEILKSLGDTFAHASPTFSFPIIEISNYFGTVSDFVSMLLLILTTQTVKQSYNIVGSIDLLGDPLTLCRRYVGGVSGFVGMASRGRPTQGAKELVKGFVGGTAGSISKMAGAVDSFLSGLQTTDAESETIIRVLHIYDRKAAGEKRRHIGHGVKSGAKHFARSMVRGVTGVVTQPIHGVQTRGAGGLVLGLGKGFTGLVVAPISGALGVTKYLVGGIDDTMLLLDAPLMGRRRPARDGKQGLILDPIRLNNLDASIPQAYHALYDDEGRLVDTRHMMSRIDADYVNKITDVTSIEETKRNDDDNGFDGEDMTNVEFKKGKKKLRFRKHVKRAMGFSSRRRSESRSNPNKNTSSFRRKSNVF